MNPLVSILVSLVSGGLAGALVGHLLVIWREKAGRRLAFRNALSVYIVDLQETTDDGVSHYDASRRAILIECAKIEGDIRSCNRFGFDSARCNYCGLPQNERNRDAQKVISGLTQNSTPATGHPPPKPDSRTVKQKMIDAMQKLKKYAE